MATGSRVKRWFSKSGAKLLLFRDMTEYKKVLNAFRRPPCRNKYSLHAFD